MRLNSCSRSIIINFCIIVPGAILPEPTKSTDNVDKGTLKAMTVPATVTPNVSSR